MWTVPSTLHHPKVASLIPPSAVYTGVFTNMTVGGVIGGSWSLGGGGGCGIGRVDRAPCATGKSVLRVTNTFEPVHVSTLSKDPPPGYANGFGFAFVLLRCALLTVLDGAVASHMARTVSSRARASRWTHLLCSAQRDEKKEKSGIANNNKK